jgi:hypothetical protein
MLLAACGEGVEASASDSPELRAGQQEQAAQADRRIILYRTPAGELYITDGRGQQHLVAARASIPVYSPDNQRAAFSKLPDTWSVGEPVTSSELHVVDLGSGRVTQVTGGNADFAPVWTPDSRFLLFVSTTRADETSFWRVKANGASLERLSLPSDEGQSVGPHERRIILYLAPPASDSEVQFGPQERRIILYKTVGAQGDSEIVTASFNRNFEVESVNNLGPGTDPKWNENGNVEFKRDGETVEVSVE